jgi:UDP-GlcNAc3NAcA epimerase
MPKIVTVIGARPQFVKAAAVTRALRSVSGIQEVLAHTGQHYDDNMSAVFFRELGIAEPAYNLAIGSGSHGAQTGRQLVALEEVLLKEQPDWVLVYGDTNSTLAGALAAAKLNLPVAHVEAGLRSFKRQMPEEINRVLTDHCSQRLFAPTEGAVRNLEYEGIAGKQVCLVGDVMYDVALQSAGRALAESKVLQQLGLKPRSYVLATIHRASNTDDPARLQTIMEGLGLAVQERPVVFPVHPRTRLAIEGLKSPKGSLGSANGKIRLIPPVGYLDMVALEAAAAVIATDSGGVQKEAFFHKTPCVTLREETEWTELVEAGWNRLCPPNTPEAIRDAILTVIGTKGADIHPYGQGNASTKIAESLANPY